MTCSVRLSDEMVDRIEACQPIHPLTMSHFIRIMLDMQIKKFEDREVFLIENYQKRGDYISALKAQKDRMCLARVF